MTNEQKKCVDMISSRIEHWDEFHPNDELHNEDKKYLEAAQARIKELEGKPGSCPECEERGKSVVEIWEGFSPANGFGEDDQYFDGKNWQYVEIDELYHNRTPMRRKIKVIRYKAIKANPTN